MSASSEPARPRNVAAQEDVVGRLRELHEAADDADRPQAALLLGLAIADFVALLPDGDPRSADLTAEGLARLAGLADSSPTTTAARELLDRYAAAGGGPTAQPEAFPLGGGDLNWDLDWTALRGPAEAARNLTATLPLLSSMLPPQAPLGQALKSIAEVMDAFDRGQWSPERDRALQAAIQQVETAGVGAGLGLMLRTVAMMIRIQRCQQAWGRGIEPDWPSLAELDALIDGLESADDLAIGLGAQFQAVNGLHHLYIAGVILMRLLVSVRRRDVRRDTAWRDVTRRLLDQVSDHLRQVPPAYADQVQVMRGKLAEMSAALGGTAGLPSATSAPPTTPAAPPPATPRPAAPAPARRPPPATTGAAPPASGPAGNASGPAGTVLSEAAAAGQAGWFNPAIGQFSQQIMDGLGIIADQAGGPVSKALAGMFLAMDAVNSRRWTPEYSDRLAELEHEADLLTSQDTSAADRAMVTTMLVAVNAVRTQQRSASPRPEEHPSAEEYAALIAETESALDVLARSAPELPVSTATGLSASLHGQAALLLVNLSRLNAEDRASLLARARHHFGQLPAGMLDQMPVLRDLSVLEQLIEGVLPPDDDAVQSVIDRDPGRWDRSGGDLQRAMLAVDRARRSQAPEDIGTALRDLQAVWIGLDAGSPMRAQLLIAMATMQNLLAVQAGDQLSATDAASTAIEAVGVATTPSEMQATAQLLVTTFSLMLARGQREGPFQEADDALRTALASAGPDDWILRLTLLTALGASATLGAAVTGDEARRVAARQAITDAERLLPAPAPTAQWYAAARILCTWTAMQGLYGNDPDAAGLALRLIGVLETVLADHPAVAQQVAGAPPGQEDPAGDGELDGLRELRQQLLAAGNPPGAGSPPDRATPAGSQAGPGEALTAGEACEIASRSVDRAVTALGLGGSGIPVRRPLAAAGQPDPGLLRSIAADLHQGLAGAVSDSRLRQQVNRLLGLCHAELYWADPAAGTDHTLREAIVHLNRALAGREHELPTVEWADTLDVLARCQREAAQRDDGGAQPPVTAERTVRAALRELARFVMVAEDTGQALEVAARANEMVVQAIGWALADGRPRAAVDLAEAGRGLILASVTLSGRVEQFLRSAGRPDAADAWRAGGRTGRATALGALWETTAGTSLLSTPTSDEVSLALAGTRFDAVVYLVPPAGPDSAAAAPADRDPTGPAGELSGHALVVRPVLGEVEVIPLPGLAGAGHKTPLDAYLTALNVALDGYDPAAGNPDGFRAGPLGRAWADALDNLGRWAYPHIMAPLVDHVRGWSLDHLPHLALIPLGDLAAIPYAAAWTDEGSPGGERRYALDDVVLSYAASARLLAEVARRPQQPLSERVVLVCEPGGEFPMSRRATRLLTSRQYPGAEVYGLKSDRNGPATAVAVLGALPARDRPGASLLQLSLHGTTDPNPQLQASDGWLPLARILDQARDRAPDAPGGLVITNACLTDSTSTHYDESLTLATAFLAAGATAVIGTRWPVDDDTVTALSLRLHLHLQMGYQPAEALRRAQLDLLRPTPSMRATLGPHLGAVADARLSHPVTWAGHVHHGIHQEHQARTGEGGRSA